MSHRCIVPNASREHLDIGFSKKKVDYALKIHKHKPIKNSRICNKYFILSV